MSRQPSLLFEPITIGRTVVRNRAVVTSHGASEAFRASGGSPATYVEYLRRRAADDGPGLIIAQPPFFSVGVPHVQEVVDRHALLAETVRAEGAVILLQLAHLGAFGRSDSDLHRPPLWGFGPAQSAAGETAHEMSDDEVELMVDAYRQTARLAAQAGFHGVEVHGGHGYLIQQSLTPGDNGRVDRWGADRTLFAREVLGAARREIGDGIVGYRTTTDDLRHPEDGGIGFEAGAEIVRRLVATGLIDVVNTTIGDGGASYARAIPDYRHSEAPNIAAVARLRRASHLTVPVIGVGRITSIGVAEAVLAAGSCDLVGMTRAHIADPDLLGKARSGRSDRIRPCVGANVCVNRKLAGSPEISCFHNPQVLRESELDLVPARHPRRVLVVGAGPAGLKAAEVAAKRGHDVTVMDRGPAPGGRLRHAGLTAASALTGSIDHLVAELAECGVKIHHGVVVDEGVLVDRHPDHVIVATGAQPSSDPGFAVSGSAHVVDTATALEGEVGPRVLVYDTVGANEGALVAEALAGRGARVTFVTPSETVMPQGGQLHRVQLPDTLFRRVAQVVTGGLIGDVGDRTVLVVRPDGETLLTLEVDTVVVVAPPRPEPGLVEILRRLGVPHRVVGDALAPRLALQAFKDGHEAALAI